MYSWDISLNEEEEEAHESNEPEDSRPILVRLLVALYKVCLAQSQFLWTRMRSLSPRSVVKWAVRGSISCVLVATTLLLWLGYFRLQSNIERLAFGTLSTAMNREVKLGRLRRLSFFGLCFGKTYLAEHREPAGVVNTKPDVTVRSLEIEVVGFSRLIFRDETLRINLKLHQPQICLRQSLEEQNHTWDLGVPLSGADSSRRRNTFEQFLTNDVVRPGRLDLRDAVVHLTPSSHTEFGHSRTTHTVRNVKGSVFFDQMLVDSIVEGELADSNGRISVNANCDLNTLMSPGGFVVNASVRGSQIPGRSVASFLNLPFRAEAGACNANLDVTFKHDLLLPYVNGDVFLEAIHIVFNPDPKTPALRELNGRLRLDHHDVFFEKPTAVLGTIPTVFDGSLNVLGDFDLAADVRPIDVNAVLDTLEVDKFFPIEGFVEAKAKFSGPIEEPIMTGVVKSVGQDNMMDRLPVEEASTNILWDVEAGLFHFNESHAKLSFGGEIFGSGTLSFDMTRLRSKSPRPKRIPPPEPDDRFLVDRHALDREYESMLFRFKARDIPGTELMKLYGGKQGEKCLSLFGLVEGEMVLGGHSKDANLNAEWRTVGPSPVLTVQPTDTVQQEQKPSPGQTSAAPVGDEQQEGAGGEQEGQMQIVPFVPPKVRGRAREWTLSPPDGRAKDGREREASENEDKEEYIIRRGPLGSSEVQIPGALEPDMRLPILPPVDTFGAGAPPVQPRQKRQPARLRTLPAVNKPTGELKSTEMSGVVAMKLGGDPEVRRIRGTTIVKSLDGRRLAWDDDQTRENFLRQVHDAYIRGRVSFDGFMRSSMLPPPVGPKGEVRHRQQQMKLLGIEGELSLPDLHINNLDFDKELCGRFFLDEEAMKIEVGDATGRERLKIRSLTNGLASLHLASKDAFVKLSSNAQAQSVFLQSSGFRIETLLGNAAGIEGQLDASAAINLTTKHGNASIVWQDMRVGDIFIDRFNSDLFLVNGKVFVEKCVVQQPSSEYRLLGEVSFPGGDFTARPNYDLQLKVPSAEMSELVELLCGRASEGQETTERLVDWEVPRQLGLGKQLAWFESVMAARAEYEHRALYVGEKTSDPEPLPDLYDVSGSFSAAVHIKGGEELSANVSFAGSDWRIGPHLIAKAQLDASVENEVVAVKKFEVYNGEGFEVHADGLVGGGEKGDLVSGNLQIKKVPADAVLRHVRHRFGVDAAVDVTAKLSGTSHEPELECHVAVAEGVINDKVVKDLKGSLTYRDVRADVDLSAQVMDRKENMPRRRGRRERSPGEQLTLSASVPYRMRPVPTLRIRSPADDSTGLAQPGGSDTIKFSGKVKRHGLLLLNLIAPDLTWVGGRSDIDFKVSGTLSNPEIDGYANVSDGKLWPVFLEDPLQRVKGEVIIDRKQVLSVKGFSGSYNGRSLTIGGELPLLDATIRVRNPITVDSAELMLNVKDYFYGKAAGKVSLSGSAREPTLSGNVVLREGIVFVQNAVPEQAQQKFVPEGMQRFGRNGGAQSQKRGESGPAELGDLKNVDRRGPAGTIATKEKGADKAASSSASSERVIGLKSLKVNLENDLSVVFPYVMNVGVNGSVVMDGSTVDPRLKGRVDVTDGSINLVTTKLNIKRDSNNYAVFSGEVVPIVEFTLENNGLTMHVRQTRADKWSSALEVLDKASDNSLDERHWIGVIANRVRGIRKALRTDKAIPDIAARALHSTYNVAGDFGEARWRLYPALDEVLNTRGGVRFGEVGVGADIQQGEAKLNFNAALNGFSTGKVSFRPNETFSLNMELTPGGTAAQVEIRYESSKKRK